MNQEQDLSQILTKQDKEPYKKRTSAYKKNNHCLFALLFVPLYFSSENM